jgi:hypothetical protein
VIIGPRKAHFAYSCFKLADPAWIFRDVIDAVRGREDRKMVFNGIGVNLVENIFGSVLGKGTN